MNQNDNDILSTKNSRFSDEDRARMAQENAGARLDARRKREEKKAAAGRKSETVSKEKQTVREKYKASADRNNTDGTANKTKVHTAKSSTARKKTPSPGVQPGSRNDRVKDSQQERKKNNIRNNNIIISMMFIVAVAIIGVFAAVALKVNVIEVNGSERYSDASVLEAAGLNGNVSMLLINAASAENKIETILPYIEEAEIKRVWPDKLTVSLTDAVPVIAVDTGEGYVLMNGSCKVLDDDAVTVGVNTALIRGVGISSAVPGKTVEFSGNVSTEDFSLLTKAFADHGIGNISEYDLTMISDISVIIDHRIEVKFGTLAGAAEKLAFGKQIIDKTIASDSNHTMIVDLTADGKAYVRAKNDSNVSFNETVEETTLSIEESTAQNEPASSGDGSFSVG